MKNSRARQAEKTYDSIGRLFVLQTKFRLIAQQQLLEQKRKLSSMRRHLYNAYRLQ